MKLAAFLAAVFSMLLAGAAGRDLPLERPRHGTFAFPDAAGAEGQSLQVFESGDGNRFTPVINDYWYQAP